MKKKASEPQKEEISFGDTVFRWVMGAIIIGMDVPYETDTPHSAHKIVTL